MFGKKEPATIMINTIIGPGCVVEGGFRAEGAARVDGCVNGDVKITGTLIVGAAGKITGNVEAQAVMIGGEVLGTVTVPMETELTATARVSGEICTREIFVEEGAQYLGRCLVYQENPDAAPQYVIPRAVKPSERTDRRTAKEALQDALREQKA